MPDGQRWPRWQPLRGLANVLTFLLGLALAALATQLIIDLSWPAGVRTSWRRTELIGGVDKVADVTMFVLGIVFVVWFHRARVNAELRDYRQRRARASTFWGWIVPIVNLWFPFQLMGDIWRAGLPYGERRKIAWLPAVWWTSWLLSGLSFGNGAASGGSSGPAGPFPEVGTATSAVGLCFLLIAGATLLPIIRTVSSGPVGRSPAESTPNAADPAAVFAEGAEIPGGQDA